MYSSIYSSQNTNDINISKSRVLAYKVNRTLIYELKMMMEIHPVINYGIFSTL